MHRICPTLHVICNVFNDKRLSCYPMPVRPWNEFRVDGMKEGFQPYGISLSWNSSTLKALRLSHCVLVGFKSFFGLFGVALPTFAFQIAFAILHSNRPCNLRVRSLRSTSPYRKSSAIRLTAVRNFALSMMIRWEGFYPTPSSNYLTYTRMTFGKLYRRPRICDMNQYFGARFMEYFWLIIFEGEFKIFP